MNPLLLQFAIKGASSAFDYFRNNSSKKEREIYDALLDAVKDGRISDLVDDGVIDDVEDAFSAARAEAGDVTKDIHDRLDRRRAAFAAAAPDRKSRREALKHDARKQLKRSKSSNTAGKVVGGALGAAAVAAAGWAVWEFYLADKLAEDKPGTTTRSSATTKSGATTTTTRTATSTEEAPKSGTTRLVYSTNTEDAAGEHNDLRPRADMTGSAGPLGEDPAVRDEELLASIDEQLTTLDTLEDDQRQATAPRHGKAAGNTTGSDVLKDTGSGRRSDKVSDADTTIGASGRHELRKDDDERNR